MVKIKLLFTVLLLTLSYYTNAQNIKIGEKAPDFKLWLIDGTTLTQEDAKGKVVVFKFWFTSCAPCISDFPESNSLVDSYKNNKNILFLAPALDRKDVLKSFFKNRELKYQTASAASDIAAIYNPEKSYPTHIVIDKKGVIRYIDTGQKKGDFKKLKKAIQKLML